MLEDFLSFESLNYAAFAIPAFFLFTGLEYFVACQQQKKHLFKFDSSVANLSIGVAERLLNLFLTLSFYELFQFVYENYALFAIPNTPLIWIALLLATDLVWYWYHRCGHEINVLWAAHIVHHQSEEFNYTVSARITTLQAIIRNIFWCLLPLAGFHPSMVIATLIIHGAYSFFTHTQLIPKLGWLEHIFITPSHHRVHHASNEKYLNKNYGDLFVFWDKLFGTFQKEEEEPVYGLTHPLKSYSFIWQHVHYYMELWEAVKRSSGFTEKLQIIFGKPELLDQRLRRHIERIYLSKRKVSNNSFRYKKYVQVQFVLVIIVLFITSLFLAQLDTITLVVMVGIIFITLVICGALLEQRTWIYPLEQIRFVGLIGYVSYALDDLNIGLFIILLSLFLGSTVTVKQRFLKFIYG
jgi:sterol desaturase/sphingolipid hydroxylase (fatty acid hydroxylase superfamily)